MTVDDGTGGWQVPVTTAVPTDPSPTDPSPTDPCPTDPSPTDPCPTDPCPGAADTVRVDERREGVYARRTRIRKQEILDSALVAFGQKGFYKSTLADVASAAGITAAGLLHHFKTKDALLVELLRQRDLLDVQESAGGEHPQGRALLQHLIDTMARNMSRVVTTQMYAVLSAEAVTEAHPARQWFLDRYTDLRALIVTSLRDAGSDGEVAADVDPEGAAAAIIAVMDGIQIQWLYDPDAVDMAKVTAQVVNALVRPAVPLVPRVPTAPSPA